MEVQEYNIPVMWGHIAVKAWGNKQNTPVLAVHGIQDNAGIFDRIMPLLPNCFYYICIDLPSHGRSSNFPTQHFISPMDGVIASKLVMDYLNRKGYILLGHSWGAHILVMFTQLYPEYVLKLCVIDGIYPFPLPADSYKAYWNARIDGLTRINESIQSNKRPTYTYDEAMDKLINNRMFGGITKQTAVCLLNRCLEPVPDGKFVFTTDPRLKVFLIANSDMRYFVETAKACQISCPVLVLRASLSDVNIWTKYNPLIEEMQKNNNFRILIMEGNHDDFSNKPETWAGVISKFLCAEQSKL